MLFYRSSSGPGARPLSLAALRTLTGLALVLYPAGALLKALSPDDSAALQLGGYALIVAALIAALPILTSQVQRIVADEAAGLDEYELAVRHRTLSAAYGVFTGMVLLALIYAGMARDAGWWLPRGFDAFNALFWGALLYATLIPATLLAWSRDAAGLQGE